MPRFPRPTRRSCTAAALICALALAAPGALAARTFEESLAEGDAQYAHAHLVEARTAYLAALAGAPPALVTLARLARTESELGETLKGDDQRRMFAAAVEHARAGVKLAPDSATAHVWLAVSLGRQALREGPKAKLALSREIKSEVDRALELDPKDDRAWHVLAEWNVKISQLSFVERMAANAVLGGVPKGASFANAESAFQRAIASAPDYVHHHLEYGRLLKDLKRTAEARRELEKALALSPTSDALDSRYQAEARELLARLPKG